MRLRIAKIAAAAITKLLHIPNQVAHLYVESIRDDFQRSQCHPLPPGLDPVQVHAVQPGRLRELVLRCLLCAANRFDFPADRFLNVLHRLQPRAYAAFTAPCLKAGAEEQTN